MKTLPINIQNGRNGASEPVYLIRLIPMSGSPQNDAWAEKRWATRAITITGMGAFEGGRLMKGGLPIVNQSIDAESGAGVGHKSGFKIKLLNQDKYHETLDFDTHTYLNREIKIYIVFYTGGTLSISSCLLLMSGIVDDIQYDIEKIIFKCTDGGERRYKTIPDKKLNKKTYRSCPDDNVGMVIPLIYGEEDSDRIFKRIAWAEGLRSDEGKEKYIISLNRAKAVSDSLWEFDEQTGIFAEIYNESAALLTVTYGRPTIVEINKGYDLKARIGASLKAQAKHTSPTSLDFKNVIDDNDDTYITLNPGQHLFLTRIIPNSIGSIIENSTLSLYIRFGNIQNPSSGSLRYYNAEYDNGVGGSDTLVSISAAQANTLFHVDFEDQQFAHGKMDDQSDRYDLWQFDEISKYEWGLYCNSGWIQIKTMYLLLTGLFRANQNPVRRKMSNYLGYCKLSPTASGGDPSFQYRWEDVQPPPRLKGNIFVKMKGAKFDSWITDGRSNGWNQNDLIVCPVYIIEEILRTELGFTTADININAFDHIGNKTNGTRRANICAGKIDEEMDALDVIKNICKNALLLYWTDSQGKANITDFVYDPTTRVLDIVKLTSPQRGASSVKVYKSSLKNIYTDYYVEYKKNYGTGNYEGLAYALGDASYSETGLMVVAALARYTAEKYNKRQEMRIQANWIRDEGTAGYLIVRLARWFCLQHYIVEFTTTLNALDLEIGDNVKVDHPSLPSGIRNDKHFMVIGIKTNCQKDEINLKLMELATA